MADAKRRLLTILAADAAGYSRLMGLDEAATIASLEACRTVFRDRIAAHHGRVVDTAGDSVLAVFESVVEATHCAVEVQDAIAALNADKAPDRQMLYRIGVNLGDIVEKADGTVYGDGVNVAARLQTLAEPGGICLSGTAFDQVKGKVPYGLDYFGEQSVKNIAEPVRAYRVALEAGTAQAPGIASHGRKNSASAAKILTAAVAAIVVAAGGWWSFDTFRQSRSGAEQASVSKEDVVLSIPTGPSVLIMPFELVVDSGSAGGISKAITRDIVAGLVQYGQLFVIGYETSFRLQEESISPLEAADRLGVGYVLEGSIQQRPTELKISAALVSSETGRSVWSRTFVEPMTPEALFEIQDDITHQIVNTVGDDQGVIFRAESQRLRGTPPQSMRAYDCAIMALSFWDTYDPGDHLTAVECLEASVEKEPEYWFSWAVLSWIYLEEHLNSFNPRPGYALDRALDAARQSVELAPDSCCALYTMAAIHFYRREIEQFRAFAEKALAINPNYATALADIGYMLVAIGELERGKAMVDKALVLNPLHPTYYLFGLYHYQYRTGAYDAALTTAAKYNLPGYLWAHAMLAQAYAQLGRIEEAKAEAAHLLEADPDFPGKAWQAYEQLNFPADVIPLYIDGLRKAGLDVPDSPALTQ